MTPSPNSNPTATIPEQGRALPPFPDRPIDRLSMPPLLIQYWQAALRRRYLIGGIIATVLVIALVATLLMPKLYTARSQIEISREQKNVTNVEGLETGGGASDREFFETQYNLLRADSLGERVARQLNLGAQDGFFAAHGVAPPALSPEKGRGANAGREQMAARLLLRHIEIAPIRNSRLIDIKYTSRSAEWSARIANAWPKAFVDATMDRQIASSADARRFLQERLDGLRARLEESERNAANYASDRGIVTLGTSRDAAGRTLEPRTLVASDLEALNAALVTARTERIAAEARLHSTRAEDSDEALSNGALQGLRSRRTELMAEHARLMVQFDPGYPAARALQRQIDTLDAAITRETARFSSNRRIVYQEALKRERDLTEQVEALKTRLDRQQRDSIQFNIFQRDADTNRQLYDSLLQRYKEIGVAGTVGATNIATVDQAKVPRVPSAPNLPLNLAIGLLLGVVIAGGTVLALEQIDETIRKPADVEQVLHLPLLGNIPAVEQNPMEALDRPVDPISDAYFSVHTALSLATSHGHPRSLLVTSTQPGEGKSISAIALARTIGRIGKNALLIDADMRSPTIHNLIGFDNSQGLSNLLTGDADWRARVRSTSYKGVSVIPAGPVPPNPAELLSDDRVTELIQQLQQQFDYVIVDAPPVLGLADTPLLGRAVEGCLFVIEAETTSMRAIRHALQRLRMSQARLFGAIVTKVDYSRHSLGYGYGYGYGYSYGYGLKDAEKAGAA